MKLLNEIIDAATDTTQPVANILRKCLILAFELKNEKLKAWVEGELNGYKEAGEVPEYRKAYLGSKGNFTGPFQSWLPNRPLPIMILEEEHRRILEPRLLLEPIASYEMFGSKTEGQAVFNWPPDLIVIYQSKFIDGYALAQAWQELPSGMLIGIVDQVRSRILRFALEIREELGAVDDNPADLPAAKVESAVTNYIFGGTNVIASSAQNFTQIGAIEINVGDLTAFAEALKTLGINQKHVGEATQALLEDGMPTERTLGRRLVSWMGTLGSKLGEAGLKIGTGAAQHLVTEWAMQYWGLKP
jgi:hypothetical protein